MLLYRTINSIIRPVQSPLKSQCLIKNCINKYCNVFGAFERIIYACIFYSISPSLQCAMSESGVLCGGMQQLLEGGGGALTSVVRLRSLTRLLYSNSTE